MDNPPNGKIVDHIEHDTLNNLESNLRYATIGENNQNVKLKRNNTTGVRGVYYEKRLNKWRAQCRLNNKTYYLGLYTSKDEASKVVKEFRAQHMPFSQDAMKCDEEVS